MAKKLFVLRHGEAETDRKWRDIERPLTTSGREAVELVAHKLNGGEKVDLLISSTAVRTRETSESVLMKLAHNPAVKFEFGLYNASLKEVMDILCRLEEDYQRVLLVGHNPALSELAAWLSGQDHISLGPGQLVTIDLSIENWTEISSNCGMIVAS